MNALSHRAQHRAAALEVGAGPAATSTAADYRDARKRVARDRRDEQHRARLRTGTDREALRKMSREWDREG